MKKKSFTLIELLVVIAIISILASLLLPTLHKAKEMGRRNIEINAVKQLMFGYQSYANESDDFLLPGYAWTNTDIVDDLGLPLAMPEASKRWPWRLYPHLKGLHGTILTGKMSEFSGSTDFFFRNYYISVFPSFGLNYFNIGGQYPDPASNPANDSDCALKTNQIKHPSRLLTFVSACSGNLPYEGYMYVKDPEYGIWQNLTAPYDYGSADYGKVHARWSGRAVTAQADGHAEVLKLKTLQTELERWKNH